MCPGDQLWGIPASRFLTSWGNLLSLWFERGLAGGGGTRSQARSWTACTSAHTRDTLPGALAMEGTVESCNIAALSNQSTTVLSHCRGDPNGSPSATETDFGKLLLLLHINSPSFSFCISDYYTAAQHHASLVKSNLMWNIGNSNPLPFLRRKICLLVGITWRYLCIHRWAGMQIYVWIYIHTYTHTYIVYVYVCVCFILICRQKVCIMVWIY